MFKAEIMQEIEKKGHEVGYHYEVLDKAKGNYGKAMKIFEAELGEFRKICDVKMEKRIPYSAEHPVAPENFAGRAEQIKEFERFLDSTINENSKNVAVLGEWGIGKTSLLRMFKHIAEQNNCTGTIIELGEATDSFLTLFETITQNLRKKL